MNKYEILFDILKNRLLFTFKRYNYNDNIVLIMKDFTFVKTLILRLFNSQFSLLKMYKRLSLSLFISIDDFDNNDFDDSLRINTKS